MKIVCVGHSTYDITLPMNEYPEENKKYKINHHIECGGGPAANAAYLLAKWGMDTSIVSIVGNDYYGSKIIEDFKKVNANIDNLEIRDNYDTSSSYIIANMGSGTRTIITSRKEEIRKLKKDVHVFADAILIDGKHPETALEILNSNPDAFSIIDAGRLNDDTKFLGKKVDYLVCSKVFAEEFTGKEIDITDINSLGEIYNELKAYFNNNVIITLESAGSFTEIDGNMQIIPSMEVKALDSTGAGDIFHGALMYFMVNDYSLLDAIKLASLTSAISVTRIGSRYSIPTLSEVIEYDTAI